MQPLISKYDIALLSEFSTNIEDRKIMPKILQVQDINLREVIGNAFLDELTSFAPIDILTIATAGANTDLTFTDAFTFSINDKIIIEGASIANNQKNINGKHKITTAGINAITVNANIGVGTYAKKGRIITVLPAIYDNLFSYIIPYLCLEAYLAYLPFSSTQTTDSGFRKKKNEDSDPITPAEIAMISNATQSVMLSYKERLINHLEQSNYPLYAKKNVPAREFQRSNGLAILPKNANYKQRLRNENKIIPNINH